MRHVHSTGRIIINHARTQLVQNGFIYSATNYWYNLPSAVGTSTGTNIQKKKKILDTEQSE